MDKNTEKAPRREPEVQDWIAAETANPGWDGLTNRKKRQLALLEMSSREYCELSQAIMNSSRRIREY